MSDGSVERWIEQGENPERAFVAYRNLDSERTVAAGSVRRGPFALERVKAWAHDSGLSGLEVRPAIDDPREDSEQ